MSDKKKPEEASKLFQNIIKASVSVSPKYIIKLPGNLYVEAEAGGKFLAVEDIGKAKEYIYRNAAESAIEEIKRHTPEIDFSQIEIVKI